MVLKPQTPASRVAKRDLAVYYSDDNRSYTKVEKWQLGTGSKSQEILLDEPVVARYWKVKSLFDERDKHFNLVSKAQFANGASVLPHRQPSGSLHLRRPRQPGDRKDYDGHRRIKNVSILSHSRLLTNGKYAYVYDANGNLIQKGTNFSISGSAVTFNKDSGEYWEYQYDLLNRLTSVSKNGTPVSSYLYDESGLRLQKTGSEGTTDYVFDQSGQVIYEQENKEYLEYIYALGKHFARVDGNLDNSKRKTYFYQTDHLGSTIAVTDEAGKTVWTSEYTPFGNQHSVTGALDHAAKFTGKDMDQVRYRRPYEIPNNETRQTIQRLRNMREEYKELGR